MWNKMKQRLKEIFDTNTQEEEVHKQEEKAKNTYPRDGELDARVSYQYPKERSFKFPVIPDGPVRERENPANQKNKQKETDAQQRKEPAEKKKQERTEQKESNRPPFRPSEVASPIYGYQPRKRKKDTSSLEVPAFERKAEQKDQITSQSNENPEKIQKDAEADKSLNKDRERTEIRQTSNPVVPNPERKQKAGNETERLTSFHEYKEKKEQKVQEKLEEPAHKKKSIEEKHASPSRKQHKSDRKNEKNYNSNRSAGTEKKKAKNPVPFNVIMTPRDKKNRQTKPSIKEKNQEDPPPMHLLNDPVHTSTENRGWVSEQIRALELTLKHFHVRAKVVDAVSGPSVTRFEVQPEPGVKVSKIKNLSDDIKLNLAAHDIRMEAPIPGKSTIGIEIPNPEPQQVGLQEIFETDGFQQGSSPLRVALGLDISGKAIVTDLDKMPHGLIAGATGSGKSVCINSILISLLYKASYKDVKFLLIDPKMVELAPYNDLPHLVAPVITDIKAATSALKWAVKEMEDRYNKFVREGTRDVDRYNRKMKQQNRETETIPYLVIVIDELSDLMMAAPQDVEDAICRIAQKARACGIHLLLATQRPSVDVITGLIKANVPTRMAFSVSSQVDSRTIIDTQGAEKLLGRGDMLFVENGAGKSVRIQGAFVSDDEIERVTNFVKKTAPPQYLFEQDHLLEQAQSEEETDELYDEAVDFVFNHNGASASLLQRRFKIGYNRAARLIDQMEAKGIISEQRGSKPRDILITPGQEGEQTQVND